MILGINPSANLSIQEDTNPSVHQRLLMIQKAQADAQQSLSKYIKHYTSKRTLSPGDKVMLDAHNLKIKTPSRKLSPRRYGPFKVLKQISLVAYLLQSWTPFYFPPFSTHFIHTLGHSFPTRSLTHHSDHHPIT